MKILINGVFSGGWWLTSKNVSRLTEQQVKDYAKLMALRLCESFAALRNKEDALRAYTKQASGAFMLPGINHPGLVEGELTVQDYSEFLINTCPAATTIGAFNVPGNVNGTFDNIRALEDDGHKVTPVFSFGDSFGVLEYYVNNYRTVIIDSSKARNDQEQKTFLDECFGKYVCSLSGKPRTDVYASTMPGGYLLRRYPWYGVITDSWLRNANSGLAFFPTMLRYLPVSINRNDAKDWGKNISNMQGLDFDYLEAYVKWRGYDVPELQYNNSARVCFNIGSYAELLTTYVPATGFTTSQPGLF